MDLFSIKNRILCLQIKSIGLTSENREIQYPLHMDAVDNLIGTMNGLPEKYLAEWSRIKTQILSEQDVTKRSEQMNANMLAAQKLLTSIREWVEALSHFPGSPSFRSDQLTSIRSSELPKLLTRKKVDRKAINELIGNFFDQVIEEFPSQKEKLATYKQEFINASNAESDNMLFRRWCKSFFERVQLFFDNNCLKNEYEWHRSRLECEAKARLENVTQDHKVKSTVVNIFDSPGASVVHGSYIGGHSGGIHKSDGTDKKGFRYWMEKLIIPLVIGIFFLYFAYYMNLNGNINEVNQNSSVQIPTLENKRIDELNGSKGSVLISNWFNLMNKSKWLEACSLMAKEKCDPLNAESVSEHSKEPKFKTVDGYHLFGVQQAKNAPKDVWCVKYFYQERQSLVKRDINLIMQYHLLERSDGS